VGKVLARLASSAADSRERRVIDEVEARAVLEQRQRQVVVDDADKLVALDDLG
jgi:hypothetical protein